MRELYLLTLLIVAIVAIATATTCDPQYPYRSNNGECNNLISPDNGKVGNYYSRGLSGAHFVDGISEAYDRGNARNISNYIGATALLPGFPPQNAPPPKNINKINMLESFLGQFIIHDVSNNLFIEGFGENEVVKTPIYPGDKLYKVNAANNYIITSLSDGNVTEVTGQFEVINESTSWLDISNIYGSDDETVNALRLLQDGLLKTSTYTVQLSPFAPPVVFNNFPASQEITGLAINTALSGSPADKPTFGDPRGNENLSLFLINLVFIREHNRLATNLKLSHPDWDDETLFQEARRYNIAIYQHIIFDAYLPVILGNEVYSKLEKYEYNENINADTSVEFATGAFRYAHFAVGAWDIRNEQGCKFNYTIPAGVLGPFSITSSKLPNAGQLGGGFSPQFALALSGGIDNALAGLLKETGEEIDVIMSEDLRTISFGGSIGAGIDIFVFDIIRGRLNGIPDYHTLRTLNYPDDVKKNIYRMSECKANKRWPTVDPLECFMIITGDIDNAQKLQDLYGKINNIDAITGLMAELKENGAFLPTTAAHIILNEYIRKRDTDRFWYENGQFTEAQLIDIKSRQFSDLLRDNLFSSDSIYSSAYDSIFHTPPETSAYPVCEN